MKTSARFAATILATSALTISLAAAGPAASAHSSTTNGIANLVESVAPDQGSVVPGQLKSDKLLTKANGAEISVPTNGRSALQLSDPETKKMGPLEASLPTEARSAAKVANDGPVVYISAAGGTDAVVQVLDDGSTRIQTVTHASNASLVFDYEFGAEIEPVLEEDGTVSLTQSIDGVQVVRATVDNAWAKDATGTSIPTNYEVEGSTLRQNVLPQSDDVAYPIVADPKIRIGVGIYLYLNKIEAREVKMAARRAAIIGSAVTCAAYIKKLKAIPGVKKLAAGLCAYVGPKGVQKLFTSASRVIIKNTPNCTQLRYRVHWSTKAVAKRNCQPLNKSWKW